MHEFAADLLRKSKQVEVLINSLPVPEPEESQVSAVSVLKVDREG